MRSFKNDVATTFLTLFLAQFFLFFPLIGHARIPEGSEPDTGAAGSATPAACHAGMSTFPPAVESQCGQFTSQGQSTCESANITIGGVSYNCIWGVETPQANVDAPKTPAKRPVVELDNPLGSCDKKSLNEKDYKACMDRTTDLLKIAGKVVNTGLGILGSVALVVFIYGGGLWLTSAGNDERVHSGLNAMLYAAIGIFIIFGSYAAVGFIIKGITGG